MDTAILIDHLSHLIAESNKALAEVKETITALSVENAALKKENRQLGFDAEYWKYRCENKSEENKK